MGHKSERVNLKMVVLGSEQAKPDFIADLFLDKDVEVLALDETVDVFEAIEQELPHLVICRSHALEDRFLDLCRRLESKRKTADIPVLIVADKVSQANIAAALSAGVEDLLNWDSHKIIEIKAMRLALRTRDARERSSLELEEREIIKFLPAIVYVAKPVPPYSPIYVSQNIESLGYKVDEWFSTDDLWIKLVHPDDRDRVLMATEEALSKGLASEYEYRIIARDGTVIWVHDRGTFVRDDEGQPVYWKGVIFDITDRKQAEAREALERARFRQLFENSPAAIALLNKDRRVIRTNTAFQELFQFSGEEARGRSIADLIVPEDRKEESLALHQSPLRVVESVRRTREGRVVPVHIIGVPVELEGEETARFAVYVDLRERKQLEEQLIQSEKLAALGELISSIAHELNNPLTSVLGYATLLSGNKSLSADAMEQIKRVEHEGQRARRIIQNLLSFARKHESCRTEVNANEMIKRTLELRAYELKSQNIAVITRFGDLPEVSADCNQLQQVVLNLIINAEHALAGERRGGRIEISTAEEVDEFGHWVIITVADNGRGIQPEVMSKVFDPFFTTKERGKGTGLGLSISRRILADHGGTIQVESQPGNGASFIIRLPGARNQVHMATESERHQVQEQL